MSPVLFENMDLPTPLDDSSLQITPTYYYGTIFPWDVAYQG